MMQNITNEMSFVKVAYKVDIKLFFLWCDLIYNLIILIKYCKTPYRNLDKALWFWTNQVFHVKN